MHSPIARDVAMRTNSHYRLPAVATAPGAHFPAFPFPMVHIGTNAPSHPWHGAALALPQSAGIGNTRQVVVA